MIIRFATAIVLAVLVLVCVILARISFKRWKVPPKPRRRDFTPRQVQERRKVMAALRRVARGLRFPSLEEKEDHRRFVKLLKRHAHATGHNQFNQLRKLAKEGNATYLPASISLPTRTMPRRAARNG